MVAVAHLDYARDNWPAGAVPQVLAMDRLEMDATADSNGNVTLHVGDAGTRVHVVVEAVKAAEPRSRLLDLCGIWADFEIERPPPAPPKVIESV